MSPQGTHVTDVDGRDVLNLRQQLPLGLADDPRLWSPPEPAPADSGATAWRRCASSAAPDDPPRRSNRLAGVPRHRDAMLFGSCFDANGGVFEALLDGATP